MTGTPTLLGRLSEFAANVEYSALPAQVVSGVKHHALDTVGVCVAATKLDTSQMAAGLARNWGGPEEATLVGFPDRLPAAAAAFVNGTLAHSLEFDDTHLPSVLHPSASIIPAALAVAEAVGASGKEAIAAAAAGYEICIRTGMAGYDRVLGNSTFLNAAGMPRPSAEPSQPPWLRQSFMALTQRESATRSVLQSRWAREFLKGIAREVPSSAFIAAGRHMQASSPRRLHALDLPARHRVWRAGSVFTRRFAAESSTNRKFSMVSGSNGAFQGFFTSHIRQIISRIP
jgi:hypothetical protein